MQVNFLSLLIFKLLFLPLFLSLKKSLSDRIKSCSFSSKCLNRGDELVVAISFNESPKVIGSGILIKNNDNNQIYSSQPIISKDNEIVSYKFNPILPGSYSLKFNNIIPCPGIVTIKIPLSIDSFTSSVFVDESSLSKPIKFTLSLNFNDTFIFKEDIQSVKIIEKGAEGSTAGKFEDLKCEQKDEKGMKCEILKENGFYLGEKIKALGVFYYDRCGSNINVGNVEVYKRVSVEKEKNNKGIYASLLTELEFYKLNFYKVNKKLVVIFIYDKNLKAHRKFIEEVAAPLANLYKEYVVSMTNWENGQLIIQHFNVEKSGYPQIVIFDFSNENEYQGTVKDYSEANELFLNLKKYTLNWTKQSLTQRIFSYFRIKLNKDEETRFNFWFGVVGIFLFIGFRCHLFFKKMEKEQTNWEVNPHPKKN